MKIRGAVLVLMTAIASAGAAGQEPARVFIDEMIRGVGAHEVSCPADIEEATLAREMAAVCARFDGDFGSFQSLWHLYLLDDAIRKNNGEPGRVPHTLPQTAWEVRDGGHERIYAVGERAVGVRFDAGAVMMVYKHP